jgi:hypothetical protein
MKPSVRRLQVTALASALTTALIFGALLSSPASATTNWSVVASVHNTGQDALAITNGEAVKPSKIELKVTAASLVQWSMICYKGSELILTEGKTTFKAAGTVQLKITKAANNCQVATNAQNHGSGKIAVFIEAAR